MVSATLAGHDIVQKGRASTLSSHPIYSGVGVWQLQQSRFGRVLRLDETTTTGCSYGLSRCKVSTVAYVIAACIASISGLWLVQYAEFVSPSIAVWQRSGDLIVAIVLGGLGSRNGATLGAFFIVIMEEFLSSFFQEWRLIYGPILVLLVLFARGGLNDLFQILARKP